MVFVVVHRELGAGEAIIGGRLIETRDRLARLRPAQIADVDTLDRGTRRLRARAAGSNPSAGQGNQESTPAPAVARRRVWTFHAGTMAEVNMIIKRSAAIGTASRRAAWAIMYIVLAAPAAHAAALPTAVFPMILDDTSAIGTTGGAHTADNKRLAMGTQQLRRELAKTGRYQPVKLGPVAKEAEAANLRACGGCDAALAQKADAQISVVSWVQKVSALILNINAIIRDAKTGKVLHEGSVDIRGDTDESWSRGITYLIKNRLFAGEAHQ